jgi:gamma-glutamyltranspeptidase
LTPPSRPMRCCAHMAGLGGDGFWLIAKADGKVHGINASGPAARLATLDTYRARSENGEVPVMGPLSALTIPGAVDGWRLAHERFGRLAWDELFDAAILYARECVPVTRSLATWLALDEQILRGCSETALIDKSYAETRRGLIAAEYAWTSTKCPRAYLSSIPTRVARLRATQLLCATDRDGLIVSVIQSIYRDFGSGVVGGDTGIILQNRGAFFTLDE